MITVTHNIFRFTVQRRTQLLSKPFHARKMSSITPLLLSPTQVNDLIKSSTPVTVLDSTWFMPNSPRNAKSEYLSKRIPGSQFLDLDEVASSHDLGLKHMMPDSKTFALACGMCVVFSLLVVETNLRMDRKARDNTYITRCYVRI